LYKPPRGSARMMYFPMKGFFNTIRGKNTVGVPLAGRPLYVYFFLLAFLVFLELRLIILVHGCHLDELIASVDSIFAGMSHWRAYQNRLLGPALVQAVAFVTRQSFSESYPIVIGMLVCAINSTAFFVFLGLSRDRALAFRYTVYSALLFVAFQDRTWLYVWDLLDQIIFFIFMYLVVKRMHLRWLALLFLVAVLNREDALFISFWIIIDAVTFTGPPAQKNNLSRTITVNRKHLLWGGLLALLGVLYTKMIRDLLWAGSSLPWVGVDAEHAALGQHFQLMRNMRYCFGLSFLKDFNIAPLGALLLAFYLVARRRSDERSVKLAVLTGVMLLSTLVFGIIGETRTLLIFIPFFLVLNLLFSDKIKTTKIS
jgi:hypothetical protein